MDQKSIAIATNYCKNTVALPKTKNSLFSLNNAGNCSLVMLFEKIE